MRDPELSKASRAFLHVDGTQVYWTSIGYSIVCYSLFLSRLGVQPQHALVPRSHGIACFHVAIVSAPTRCAIRAFTETATRLVILPKNVCLLLFHMQCDAQVSLHLFYVVALHHRRRCRFARNSKSSSVTPASLPGHQRSPTNVGKSLHFSVCTAFLHVHFQPACNFRLISRSLTVSCLACSTSVLLQRVQVNGVPLALLFSKFFRSKCM